MSDLTELYQEVILDHSRRPRNFGPVPGANRSARGDNPLCGDRLDLTLAVRDGVVERAGFEGSGCAISVASASLMTEAVQGRPVAEAEALFQRFHRLVAGDEGAPEAGGEADRAGADGGADGGADDPAVAKLAVFGGVRRYPIRVKCATLPWHTLRAALRGADEEEVTTE